MFENMMRENIVKSMVLTPDILLKNDCTNFNLKKIRTAPEKKLFFLLIISLITSNNS